MARAVILLCIALIGVDAEMRETMERMVMVRTSGSDLQPAATGYIYKSDGQGPVNIIKLEESDVIKHLEAMPNYEQPEVFAAPIPVVKGPFYSEKQYGASEAYTIPVVEITGDEADASESFAQLGDDSGYHGDFDKVFSGHFGDSGSYGDHHHYGGHGGGDDYGSDHHSSHGGGGNSGYGSHHAYGDGDSGSYGKEHEEGFQSHGGGGKKGHFDEAAAHGEEYSSGKTYSSEDHGGKKGHSKGAETTGFHNVYDKNEFKKDHDFYDDSHLGGKFHKHGSEGSHHGSSDGGFAKGGSHDSGHHASGFGKHGHHDKGHVDAEHTGYSGKHGGDSYHHHHADFGAEGGDTGGKHFGYEVKH